MEFTLVLTIVLGLCVGAVVADVLFGPEQPATSSGSHGHQWDPWRRWLHQGRERLTAFARWSRENAERGWAALTRTFPERRPGPSAPSTDVLPPPVAPPLHPERIPPPPVTYVDTSPLRNDAPRPLVGPIEPPAPLTPEPIPAPPLPTGFGTGTGIETSAGTGTPTTTLNGPAGNGPATGIGAPPTILNGPTGNGPAAAATGVGSATATATALRPSTEPVTITIPRHVRVKAGAGLLLFTAVAGLGLAMLVLLVIGLAVRVLGGI